MRILGIHAIGHDTGAALVEDNRVLHSVETERLTRRRFDHRVGKAIDFILSRPGCGLETVDAVAVSTPIGHDEVHVADIDAVMATLSGKVQTHVQTRCRIRDRELPCLVVTHEASHAMLAVHYAGYRNRCLVLVNEGQGQFSQNALFVYQDGELTWRETDALPWFGRGLGWTGIGVLFGMGNSPGVAGKLMAMGGYGRPDARTEGRLREIRDEVTTDRGYAYSVAEELDAEGFLGDFDRRATIVATFQEMFSEAVVKLVTSRMARYACDHVALGGGCGLNIVTNTVLRDTYGIHPHLAPACNDSGHPLGAVAYANLVLTGQPLDPFPFYLTGTAETDDEMADALKAAGMSPEPIDLDRIVLELAGGGVVGFLRGRAESGPRALGHRSLLGNPDAPGMRQRISEGLKSREWYRPLAAMLTDERFDRLYPDAPRSPHMLFDYTLPEGVMPQARHADGTSRLQTVSARDEPVLHDLLTRFSGATGTPGLINTSLNAAGRAIALTCDDMLTDFMRSDVGLFVAGDVMAARG